MSAPTWNEYFDLPDGLYTVSDIQGYVEYIFKKHRENTNNPSIKLYVNKIEKKTTFKIKTGYYLEILTLETTKLLASTEKKINENKNGETVPHL